MNWSVRLTFAIIAVLVALLLLMEIVEVQRHGDWCCWHWYENATCEKVREECLR